MRLWMSGEVFSDIGDEFRVSRNQVEETLGTVLRDRDYGGDLAELAIIPIILPRKLHDMYPEQTKYRKKKKEAEFRRYIEYLQFKASDLQGKSRLIVNCIIRCIESLERLPVKDVDIAALKEDVITVARQNNWL